jgi:hypothetical protein
MRSLTFLLCLYTFSAFAQEAELKQILSLQDVSAFGMSGLTLDELYLHDEASLPENMVWHQSKVSASRRIEAYAVATIVNQAFTYHIADYYNGIQIITCLDGELKGLQVIAVDGYIKKNSDNVDWFDDYFIHYYTDGTVYSYPNKQIMEIL